MGRDIYGNISIYKAELSAIGLYILSRNPIGSAIFEPNNGAREERWLMLPLSFALHVFREGEKGADVAHIPEYS